MEEPAVRPGVARRRKPGNQPGRKSGNRYGRKSDPIGDPTQHPEEGTAERSTDHDLEEAERAPRPSTIADESRRKRNPIGRDRSGHGWEPRNDAGWEPVSEKAPSRLSDDDSVGDREREEPSTPIREASAVADRRKTEGTAGGATSSSRTMRNRISDWISGTTGELAKAARWSRKGQDWISGDNGRRDRRGVRLYDGWA
jgi:hypothetical protein